MPSSHLSSAQRSRRCAILMIVRSSRPIAVARLPCVGVGACLQASTCAYRKVKGIMLTFAVSVFLSAYRMSACPLLLFLARATAFLNCQWFTIPSVVSTPAKAP